MTSTTEGAEPTKPQDATGQGAEQINLERLAEIFGPIAEPLIRTNHAGQAERIRAMGETEVQKTRIADEGATKRHTNITYTLIAITAATTTLAVCALNLQQAAVAEKIVIGLFGFLAGFGARK